MATDTEKRPFARGENDINNVPQHSNYK
jgi:hypothetical protein